MADNDLLKRLLDAGMTFTALTQARAEEVIRDLVRAGAVQAEQAQASVDELIERGRRNRERLVEAVRTEIEQQLARLDLATRDDLDRMVQRFVDAASRVMSQAAPLWESASAPAKKAAAKKSAAKKSAAKKAGAKKAGAKKAPAKKSAAKGGTRKSAAKKAGAKKSAAKKSTAKKGGARKSASTGSSSGA